MKTALFASILTALWIGMISLSHAQVPQIINYQGRVAVGAPPVNFDGTGQFKFAFVNGGGAGVAATASATVLSGRVTAISVISGGFGYLTPPVVTVSGIGSGATATASVLNGAVTSITVTSQGGGYIFGTFVSVAPPPPPVYTTYWSNDGTGFLGQQPTAAVSLAVSKGLYSVLLGDATLANMTAIPASVFANSDVRLRVWFNDGVNDFQLLSPDQRIAAVGYAMMAGNVPAGAIGASQLAEGAVTSAKLAAGAVGSAQLAANAVQTANIAAGAVTASQIAGGSVNFGSLAKPPQSGSVDGAGLSFDFGQATFTVTFPQPFAAVPVVTLALAPGTSTFPNDATLQVVATTATGFTGRIVTFDSLSGVVDGNTANLAGTSVAVANGRVAVCYYNGFTGELRYARNVDGFGKEWGSPVVLAALSINSPPDPSMASVNGRPAISYYEPTSLELMYVRANDSNGTTWGTPGVLDSTGQVGTGSSLVVVNSRPAISYHDLTNGDLKFVRASDASGTAWGSPMVVDSVDNVGGATSMAIVSGNPAISYYDSTNGDLKYVRATDNSGTAWGPPVTVDSAGDVGRFKTSLVVVNGNPAIAYFDDTNGDLKYVRATNTTGTAWGTPHTVDGADTVVGGFPSLAVINGNPAITYSDSTNQDLKYVRATDANGGEWGTPATIESRGSVGSYPSLMGPVTVPIIVYSNSSDGELKSIYQYNPSTNFKINWIALPP